MSFVDTSAGEGPRLRTWAAAFALVLGLHALVVAVFLGRPLSESAHEAPPAPIMIELPPIASTAASMPSEAVEAQAESAPASMARPEPVETDEKAKLAETMPAEKVETREEADTAPPVSPEVVRTQTPPDVPTQQTATEVKPDAPPTATAAGTPVETVQDAPPAAVDETPPETVEAKPEAVVADIPPEEIVPDTPDPEALMAAEPAPPPPPKPAVGAPSPTKPIAAPQARRPEPARPTKTAERPPPKPGPAAARPAAPAAAPASTPSAASAGGKPDPSELGRYKARIHATLERRKTVPAGAGRPRVVATVRFTVDRSGRVLRMALVKGSGNAPVDQTALAMIRQDSFPAAPASLPAASFTFEFNISFTR